MESLKMSVLTWNDRLAFKAASFFGRRLKNETKRMIFLSTLTGYLKDSSHPDPVMLEKLNELFSLSTSSKALEFPMTIHSKIWGKFDIVKLNCIGVECKVPTDIDSSRLAFSQRRRIATEMINFVPEWLKYGSVANMQNDIIKLLLNLTTISAKAA